MIHTTTKPQLPPIATSLSTLLRACITVALIAVCIIGCGKDDGTVQLDERLDSLDAVLTDLEVPFKEVKTSGKTVTIVYETSDADEYDTQIVADWGMMMGAAADFPYDTIIIQNTINGKPAALLTTTRKNVRAYLNDSINTTTFWEHVDITAAR